MASDGCAGSVTNCQPISSSAFFGRPYRADAKRAVAAPGDPGFARIPSLADDGHRAVPRAARRQSRGSFDSRIFGYVPATRILAVVAGSALRCAGTPQRTTRRHRATGRFNGHRNATEN